MSLVVTQVGVAVDGICVSGGACIWVVAHGMFYFGADTS